MGEKLICNLSRKRSLKAARSKLRAKIINKFYKKPDFEVKFERLEYGLLTALSKPLDMFYHGRKL